MSKQQISQTSSKELLNIIIMALNEGSPDAMNDAQECKEEIYMRGNLTDIHYADYLFKVI